MAPITMCVCAEHRGVNIQQFNEFLNGGSWGALEHDIHSEFRG
ncbi:MAG: hypothetical protein Q7U28_00210 [Aquabacterium sp.]|nr:hypothetical protein [Aquabacterium sp.]